MGHRLGDGVMKRKAILGEWSGAVARGEADRHPVCRGLSAPIERTAVQPLPPRGKGPVPHDGDGACAPRVAVQQFRRWRLPVVFRSPGHRFGSAGGASGWVHGHEPLGMDRAERCDRAPCRANIAKGGACEGRPLRWNDGPRQERLGMWCHARAVSARRVLVARIKRCLPN